MTPEEYQRIKEAEKEHLRAIKKLKEKLRQIERQNTVAQALEDIKNAPGEDILQTHEEMIDRLAMEAIQREARLEVALSDAGELEPQEIDSIAEREASDAELQKIRAQDLVRQIKIQMGIADAHRKQEKAENVTTPDSADKEISHAEGSEAHSPVNPTPQNTTEPGELPEKTIGRIPGKRS